MARDLNGQAIIITGASSGIGAATAIECAKAGMNVVLNARRAEKLEGVAREVQAHGGEASIVPGHVAEPEVNTRLIESAANEFGGFYAAFANAGYGMDKTVLDTSDEEIRGMFEVNFFAALDLLRKSANALIEQNRPGHLLMCTSCLARFAIPKHGPYCATKAAQNQMCWTLRGELRERNIEVSSVLPVTTTTEFFAVSARKGGKDVDGTMVPDHTPKFFLQPPEKVARAIVRCLNRPHPEVWTSHIMRLITGAMTAFPSFGEFVVRRASSRLESH